MTLKEAIEILSDSGVPSPREDARLIFSEIGKIPRHTLIFPKAESDSPEVISAVRRRAKREPLQYIIGEVGFYRERYTVTPDCLIPREDTEALVDLAVKSLPRGARFLDLCTGSGCVAISALKNTESTTALAVDISPEALMIAEKNAEQNGVSPRIDFLELDVTKSTVDGEFFAVLSNPPYVKAEAYRELSPEIYFEPKCAFLGGDDGLDFYRVITKSYSSRIPKDGFIAFEIGFDQGKDLVKIAKENGMTAEIIADLSGNDRIAVLRRN